ncbi:MAG TPA: flippase [Chitinophagales bacterium]|nr:flippase [Chitinophagales bacterium]HNA65718.1 flippase [Saprospiraceae bacterium]HMU69290.1 flippase [Chitinophagales bacterium]HMX03444.1 flippase [Chitinophagales bacterium]HNE44850.1 flippase [Chitinophagales bacterium]
MIRKITKKFRRKLKDQDFKEIFSKGISGTAISLVGRFSGYLLLMVIGWVYGQEAMGVYTVGLSILSIVGIFGRFGVDMAMSRFVAQYGGSGRWDLIRHTYSVAFRIVFFLGLFLSAATFFIVPYFTDNLFDTSSPNYDQYTFFMQIFAVTILFYVLGGLSEECIKGLKKTRQYSWISQTINQVAAIAFLLLFGLFSKDELWVNLSYCLGVFVAFAIAQYYWIYYLKHPEVGGSEFGRKKDKKEKKPAKDNAAAAVLAVAQQEQPINTGEMLKLSAPMMMAKYLTMIYTWLDILILAWYAPEAMVSIYRVATRLTSLSTIPLVSINSIAGPKFAEAFGKNDQRSLRNNVKQATRMIFWTCIPILAIFLIFPKFSMWTFGKDFTGSEAVTVFVIVSLGQAANILTGPVTVLLNMTGRQNVTMYYALATVVIDVSLNLILIPIYGIIGAAIATAVARTVLNVGCALQIYFTMGISTIYNPFADLWSVFSKKKMQPVINESKNEEEI